MAKNNKEVADDEEVKVPRRGRKLLLFILIFLFLLVASAGYTAAAWYFEFFPFEAQGPTIEDLAKQKAEKAAYDAELNRDLYIKFEKPFTFNLVYNNRSHACQVELVLVVSGVENEKLAKKHLDLLAATSLQILSDQVYEELLQPTGREQLRIRLVDALRGRLTEVAKTPAIEQVLYSAFVLQ